jgi:hypothetical protein
VRGESKRGKNTVERRTEPRGGKEEEEQTCIPLFLLKETEEAKEKATNKRK